MWRRREVSYPKVEFDNTIYYVISPKEVGNANGLNVKFEGIVDDKPVLTYYVTGWPWSISSRLVEEDHGHRTFLKVSGVRVIFRGVALVSKGEKVTVYGRVRDDTVQAHVIETSSIIFKSK